MRTRSLIYYCRNTQRQKARLTVVLAAFGVCALCPGLPACKSGNFWYYLYWIFLQMLSWTPASQVRSKFQISVQYNHPFLTHYFPYLAVRKVKIRQYFACNDLETLKYQFAVRTWYFAMIKICIRTFFLERYLITFHSKMNNLAQKTFELLNHFRTTSSKISHPVQLSRSFSSSSFRLLPLFTSPSPITVILYGPQSLPMIHSPASSWARESRI